MQCELRCLSCCCIAATTCHSPPMSSTRYHYMSSYIIYCTVLMSTFTHSEGHLPALLRLGALSYMTTTNRPNPTQQANAASNLITGSYVRALVRAEGYWFSPRSTVHACLL